MRIKDELVFNDFLQMEALEKQYYSEEYVTTAESSYEWYQYWEKSIVAVSQKTRMIGFLNLFPISKALFDEILTGKYNDKALKPKDILIPDSKEISYDLFLSCILVDKAYRKSCGLNLLLKKYLQIYEAYEKAGYQFKSVITDNVTESGLRFSKSTGLKPVVYTEDSTICLGTYEAFKMGIKERMSEK